MCSRVYFCPVECVQLSARTLYFVVLVTDVDGKYTFSDIVVVLISLKKF